MKDHLHGTMKWNPLDLMLTMLIPLCKLLLPEIHISSPDLGLILGLVITPRLSGQKQMK